MCGGQTRRQLQVFGAGVGGHHDGPRHLDVRRGTRALREGDQTRYVSVVVASRQLGYRSTHGENGLSGLEDAGIEVPQLALGEVGDAGSHREGGTL